jgi:hypothetical protein
MVLSASAYAKQQSQFVSRAVHVCSQIHAVIILPLALRCLALPELDADRAFGWHEHSGTLQAIASA